MKTINHKKGIRYFLQSILSIILALLIASPTLGLSESLWEEYGINGIYYYNPTGSTNCNGGTYVNYAGAKVLQPAQIQALNANQPFYEAAAAQYGFPWQILAALHYAEYSLQRSNPANGQGVYQLYSYVQSNPEFLPAGPISDEEFTRQTNIAADLIANSYGAGLDLNDPEDVKLLFFRYNGVADVYIQKALDMGFSQYEADHGAGSPYVMNRYDAKRDPTSASVSPYWSGRFTADGEYTQDSVSERFGTFVVYEALGGAGFCINGLVSGGMNYDQAYEFVKTYVDNPGECRTYSDMCNIYSVEVGGNCVTFSSYFLGKYTTMGKVGLPNGRQVVEALANKGLPTGAEPRPYAIFSVASGETICSDGKKCGHTGVVLGIDEDKNEIYIGQMSYSRPRSWGLQVIRSDLSRYRNGSYTYAYTEGILKGGL